MFMLLLHCCSVRLIFQIWEFSLLAHKMDCFCYGNFYIWTTEEYRPAYHLPNLPGRSYAIEYSWIKQAVEVEVLCDRIKFVSWANQREKVIQYKSFTILRAFKQSGLEFDFCYTGVQPELFFNFKGVTLHLQWCKMNWTWHDACSIRST